MAETHLQITIDGPAGAGKNAVGKRLADELGYLFVDTGAMYRAITWLALQAGIAPDAPDAATRLGALADQADLEITRPTPAEEADERQYTVRSGGRDITWQIRERAVEGQVSVVSSYAPVRRVLVERQRELAQGGRVVMVGRDIGTVVLPEADLKIYLTASAEERTRRRYRELVERGQIPDFEEIRAEIARRDRIDSSRALSPLRPAKDALLVETDGKTIAQVVEYIAAHLRELA